MKRPDSKTLTLLSAGGADIAAQLERLGWSVQKYDGGLAGMDERLLLIDARAGVPDALAVPSEKPLAGATVAIVGEEGDFQSLIGLGISHFLPWPCGDALLGATLDAVTRDSNADEGDKGSASSGHDRLTGLMSRSAARAWLDARLDDAAEEKIFACLLIGISQFANINAAYGKVAGDAVLARAAARIVRCVERSVGMPVMVARMGGTEYLVALGKEAMPTQEGTKDPVSAEDIARLILSNVSQPFIADEQVIRLTARCGIAEPVAGDDAASLLRRANAALADARRSTTNDISMRSARGRGGNKAHGGDADRLDADLRLALDRGEIGIVYQPQYDSLTDRILGVEALARWNHPVLGQLDAGTLFEAADRSDYLLPLSLHIQRTALEEAGRWPGGLEELRLAINVTAADLAQDDFVTLLFDMIDQSRFPRNRLTVEITENGLIENIDRAAGILQELRQEGLWVAIDDFGTGYSSLAYLKSLHPDYLKIDHSLSRDILGTPRDRIILRAIIAMARSLALTVVAEGVESEQQLTLLAREGCDIYQGFLRSPAVTSEELVKLVEAG
tara:strand:+ start:40258 stop:41943 length:1686 start_codon:yes stop_codon:yes gene_type:complete